MVPSKPIRITSCTKTAHFWEVKLYHQTSHQEKHKVRAWLLVSLVHSMQVLITYRNKNNNWLYLMPKNKVWTLVLLRTIKLRVIWPTKEVPTITFSWTKTSKNHSKLTTKRIQILILKHVVKTSRPRFFKLLVKGRRKEVQDWWILKRQKTISQRTKLQIYVPNSPKQK